MTSSEPEQGVWYDRGDCLGVGRRILIDLIDVLLAVLISIGMTLVASLVLDGGALAMCLFLVWPGVSFAYFVLLKASRLRTVGYRAAGARIVNFSGGIPSIPSLTVRLLFTALGPLNAGLDLLWIPSDPAGQALRDKFAHTYVIRSDAQPKGRGRIQYVPYTIFGWSFLFPEVSRTSQSTAP